MNKFDEAMKLLDEKVGNKDGLISLSTIALELGDDGKSRPAARIVDAYYEDGAFYVLTHGLSAKMKQIEQNPTVAISGDWFTAHGKGVNLGCFAAAENAPIANKMKQLFSAWIDNGHNDFNDVNTCILRIQLTRGTLFSNGTCYEIDFT